MSTQSNETQTLAIANETDIIVSISAADLLALLILVHTQVDCVDEDEAEAYGLTMDEAARLEDVAAKTMSALLVAQIATLPPCQNYSMAGRPRVWHSR